MAWHDPRAASAIWTGLGAVPVPPTDTGSSAAKSKAPALIREARAPALAVAFWRNAFAVAVLGPVCAARRRAEIARLAPGPAGGALLAGLFLSAHFATWVPSLSFTTVASSVALVATPPVWAALLARARGHDAPA